jgi:HD superfamily phosphohydrolase YqeK
MNDFLLYLTQPLTPTRLQHSQGVMRVMADLLDIFGLEHEQALTAGLLHDTAKDLNQEYLLR